MFLVVLSRPGVLRPRLDRVHAQPIVLQQRASKSHEIAMHRKEAQLDARERKVIDATELVIETSVPGLVHTFVELLRRGKQQPEVVHRWRELSSGQKRGQHKEAVLIPGS